MRHTVLMDFTSLELFLRELQSSKTKPVYHKLRVNCFNWGSNITRYKGPIIDAAHLVFVNESMLMRYSRDLEYSKEPNYTKRIQYALDEIWSNQEEIINQIERWPHLGDNPDS